MKRIRATREVVLLNVDDDESLRHARNPVRVGAVTPPRSRHHDRHRRRMIAPRGDHESPLAHRWAQRQRPARRTTPGAKAAWSVIRLALTERRAGDDVLS